MPAALAPVTLSATRANYMISCANKSDAAEPGVINRLRAVSDAMVGHNVRRLEELVGPESRSGTVH
jgi:hypothetical protein